MLYKKEIHEVNQLTKRFHRDCRRIFAQIREDIQDTVLTKDEIKALIAAFGNSKLLFRFKLCLDPHIDTWESRVNCTLHKFDDFLSGLEAVSFLCRLKSTILNFKPDEKIETESESDCELTDSQKALTEKLGAK